MVRHNMAVIDQYGIMTKHLKTAVYTDDMIDKIIGMRRDLLTGHIFSDQQIVVTMISALYDQCAILFRWRPGLPRY